MAEPYGIAFAVKFQRRGIARAEAGAVQTRQEQDRQDRHGLRERRKRHALRQDKSGDAMKRARQAGAGGNPATMKAVVIARLPANTRPGPSRSQNPASDRAPSRLAAFASRAS